MGNFKKVGGKFNYVKYAELESGQVIVEGTYLGTRQGNYGIQHQVKTENGEVTVLNSSGHLNYLLENHVSKGDCIQVTYKGTETLTKGKFKGKDMHQFEVAVDEDRRSGGMVSTLEPSGSPASDEDDDDTSSEGDDEEETDEEEEEEVAAAPTPPPAPAKAPAAAKPAVTTTDVINKYRNKKGA